MKYEAIKARDIVYNRKVLEQKKGIILIGLENSGDNDKPKYLDSGINSVMARIAATNGNFVGIDIGSLKNRQKGEKAYILARIRQNIEICRKVGAKLAVSGMNSKEEISSLIESLGGSTRQASEAISF